MRRFPRPLHFVLLFTLLGADAGVGECEPSRRPDRVAQCHARELQALLDQVPQPVKTSHRSRAVTVTIGTTKLARDTKGRTAVLFADGSWAHHEGRHVIVFTPARGAAGPKTPRQALRMGLTVDKARPRL